MIFVIALAVVTILSALLLVYAGSMRTEAAASAHAVAGARAGAVERGAEQWVLATVEQYTTPVSGGNTAATNVGFGQVDITTIPAAGLAVGDPAGGHGGGYFWLLNPDPDNDQVQRYGIVDESAKYNLNLAGVNELRVVPDVTQAVADSIVDWVDADEDPTGGDGAESSAYSGNGADAYPAKNSEFDTVDELLMVQGCTPAMLYGMDLNRDGVVDAAEQQAAAGVTQYTNDSTITDRRGFANYVTCYTTRAVPGQVAQRPRGGQLVQNTLGLINVNTAPAAVMYCIPGLTVADAQLLASQRQQNGAPATTDLTWVKSALGNSKYNQIFPYVTAQSYQYSADIVAVSGGRAGLQTGADRGRRANPAGQDRLPQGPDRLGLAAAGRRADGAAGRAWPAGRRGGGGPVRVSNPERQMELFSAGLARPKPASEGTPEDPDRTANDPGLRAYPQTPA